jgi:diketogulonate reductase-like aldo/keto reductase
LLQAGSIRYWGVSNFDEPDMRELWSLSGGTAAATNQVLYNPSRRGIEWDLLPWCQQHGLPVMAYSPIEQGRLLRHAALKNIGARHDATPAQVALAWVIAPDGVNAIPRASGSNHVRENRAAANIQLSQEEFALLDGAFPPPTSKRPLEML